MLLLCSLLHCSGDEKGSGATWHHSPLLTHPQQQQQQQVLGLLQAHLRLLLLLTKTIC
jgi:hypothetical protein